MWAYLARARALAGKGETVASIADYTEAVELAPNLAPLYAERGAQRKKAKDDVGASQDLARAQALETEVASGPDARLRTIAAWELGRARAVDRSEQLTELLKDPEASVRGAAAAALGILHAHPPKEAAAPSRPAFVPALAGLLKDPEAMVRGRAIQALLEIDAREYIKDVEGLLGDTGKTSVPDTQSKEWIALEVREVASRAMEVWKATGDDKK